MRHATDAQAREPQLEMIPKPLARMMFALVLASFAIVSFAVLTDRTPTGQPKPSPAVSSMDLIIRTGGAQSVTLYDTDGTLLREMGHGGFVTVIGSGLDRARLVAGVSRDLPVTIARHQNGRLSVTDPATGWSAELHAFGSDNEAAFARLLGEES